MDTNLYEKRTSVLSQLTNTFHRGMDTDTSDILIGSDQYRYAQNLRITVDGSGTSGELHTIKGTKEDTIEFNGELVLAFSTIRDLCVAVLYNETECTWRIVKWKSGDTEVTPVFGPSSKKIWKGEEPTLKTLSTVLRWESEKNVKYYIANGVTELISINIGKDATTFLANTQEEIDVIFEKAFQYQGDGLPLITAKISDTSGSLKPAMVQYAYRLYIQNGAASDMSALTKPIYLVKNDYEGYAQTDTTGKAVDLSFPNTEVTGNLYIQIYRINYQQNGQLPAADIIVDLQFVSEMSIIDTGLSVQSISAAEFLSELDTHIIPKMIESKGDILYAANIEDGMTETILMFESFDARSYSRGNRYKNANNEIKEMFPENGDPLFITEDIDNRNLSHLQFPPGTVEEWNKDYWDFIESGGFGPLECNGLGKYIKWKYVYDDETPKYRAGEVYRFGIVLYDKHGKAAPVKWIADIMIPDYYNRDILSSLQRELNLPTDELYYNYHIGIKFFVSIPEEFECSGYDIVRCDRDFSSRSSLFQGIAGFTTCTDASNSTCFNPGFFTLDTVLTTHTAIVDANNGVSNLWWVGSCDPEDRLKPFKVDRSLLMFACPEYCYNHTQVKDLLDTGQDFRLQIIDRRDVDFISGTSKHNEGETYSSNVKKSFESLTTGVDITGYLKDDDRTWVHSPALNILDNNPNRLAWAGLGFKIATNELNVTYNTYPSNTDISDIPAGAKYLELNAGFVGLLNRKDLYSDFDAEIDSAMENGTWDINIPQALREISDSSANRVCTFFNWFGNNGLNTEFSWHTRNSSILRTDNNVNIYSESYKINDVAFVTARRYDQFVEGKSSSDFNIKAFDLTTPISNINFVNWSLGSLNREIFETNDDFYSGYFIKDALDATWNISVTSWRALFSYFQPSGRSYNSTYQYRRDVLANIAWYPIGGGDDLILLKLNDNAVRYTLDSVRGNNKVTSPRIYVANIKKPCTPYGGYTDAAIKNSKYYSFGNYVSLKDKQTFMNPDTLEHVVISEIKIGGGDTFLCHFKYNALHWWNNTVYNKCIAKMCTIYDVVLETDVNINAQHGYLYRTGRGYTDGEYKIQHDAPDGIPSYSQSKNSYMYNSGYSCRPNLIPKTSDTRTAGETSVYDTRIQYSNKKTNNESIDSWMDFKSNNFLDVDSRFGEITDIKLFKDKLMFWLNNAAGILSTNERTILQNTDDASIILGDGSVLQRFDYISLIYGQKPNQHTACATNTNLYWWDEYRKEILHYNEGYNVVPLSTVKLIKNYISERTPVDVPTISYDVDNNEVICHVVTEENIPDQSLVFNEAVQAFTAVYTFSPIFYGLCMDKQYMIGKGLVQIELETEEVEQQSEQVEEVEPEYEEVDMLYEYNIKQNNITLFGQNALPKVRFVINNASDYTKTFDIQVFGGKFYGGGTLDETATLRNGVYDTHRVITALNPITFSYSTPLKQHASINAENAVTNAEYDFRLTIPRDGEGAEVNPFDKQMLWGNRLRGKLMHVELSSSSNNSDFALHYITTKYRISWS